MAEMFHRFHIHGRMGPVVYALSAIEIALWDIAGKLASLPIASLLGRAPCELTAYASLLRYAGPELVASARRKLCRGLSSFPAFANTPVLCMPKLACSQAAIFIDLSESLSTSLIASSLV